MDKNESWLYEILPIHENLTSSVVTIVEQLLKTNNIQYLSVTGRTKAKKSVLDKIKRKNYTTPETQITDLSGIRIILYSETDVDYVSKLIEKSFKVDQGNSSNKDDLLAKNEIGYRSVHMVCDLGMQRTKLPEFTLFKNLKFEFQIRTILQHAWAELSHDREYKFNKQLPPKLERQLYLFAGMLEVVDNGLDELSKNIDKYIIDQSEHIEKGELNQPIDALNIQEFYKNWFEKNNPPLYNSIIDSKSINNLVKELKQFGITTLKELNEIIPKDFSDVLKEYNHNTNILGSIRHWMLIKDYKKFKQKVEFSWRLSFHEYFKHYFKDEEEKELRYLFKIKNKT